MNEPEYQHLDVEHAVTGEKMHLKIGPMPVHMRDFPMLLKKAFKENGKAFDKHWNIVKAWVGK